MLCELWSEINASLRCISLRDLCQALDMPALCGVWAFFYSAAGTGVHFFHRVSQDTETLQVSCSDSSHELALVQVFL